MISHCLIYFVFCVASFGTSPVHDANDFGEISNVPNEETGKRVAAWTVDSKVNPEELGNYFEGDIILPNLVNRNGVRNPIRKWPNGVVPFEISATFTAHEVQLIYRAMQSFHKYSCIRFVPKQPWHVNYVHLANNATGCWSSVGMQKEPQLVNLQSNCFSSSAGIIIHELNHAVGFYHQHTVPNRDEYVRIIKENIKSGDGQQLRKNYSEQSNYGVSYDYGSIMHYSAYVYSKNGKPTMVALKPGGQGKMGQRCGFSYKDLIKLNRMYNCPMPFQFTNGRSDDNDRTGDIFPGGCEFSALQTDSL